MLQLKKLENEKFEEDKIEKERLERIKMERIKNEIEKSKLEKEINIEKSSGFLFTANKNRKAMKFIKEKLKEEEEYAVNIPNKKDIKLNFLKFPELQKDPIAEGKFTPPRTTFSLERSASTPRLSKMTDSSNKNEFITTKPPTQETEIEIQQKKNRRSNSSENRGTNTDKN